MVWFNANMTWFCEIVLRLCAWSNSIIMAKESRAALMLKCAVTQAGEPGSVLVIVTATLCYLIAK